jgi:hypothetical protein
VTVSIPSIACTLSCYNGAGNSGVITYSGCVSNSGNATLAPVAISNFVNGAFTLVTNITNITAGGVACFSGSYVPANPCLPSTNVIYVAGTDALGSNVTSTCSAICSNCVSPVITSITVTAATAVVSFRSLNSYSHVLEYNASPAATGWSQVLPAVTGNGGVMSQTDTNATVPRRFYRIRVQ